MKDKTVLITVGQRIVYFRDRKGWNQTQFWKAIGYSTRASHIITDLESYRPYWFCVSAIGSEGEGRKCDPALGRAA